MRRGAGTSLVAGPLSSARGGIMKLMVQGRNLGRRRGAWRTLLAILVALAVVAGFAGAAGWPMGDVVWNRGVCKVLSVWGFECDLGTLPNGASATIQITVPAREAGVLTDIAVVDANEPDPNPNNNRDVEQTVIIDKDEVDLVIKKVHRPDPGRFGEPLTFIITVTNNKGAAKDVVIEDQLPFGVTLKSAQASQGKCYDSRRVVTCDIGILRKGETVRVTIVVIPETIGFITNVACARTRFDEVCDRDVIEIEKPPRVIKKADLQVVKKDKQDPVKVGDNVIYTITVTNKGPNDATGVMLTDTLRFAPEDAEHPAATLEEEATEETEAPEE